MTNKEAIERLLYIKHKLVSEEHGKALALAIKALEDDEEFHDNKNNSCRTCFFNDKGFCQLKYFTIYDDSYGCDLYSKMKDDNI